MSAKLDDVVLLAVNKIKEFFTCFWIISEHTQHGRCYSFAVDLLNTTHYHAHVTISNIQIKEKDIYHYLLNYHKWIMLAVSRLWRQLWLFRKNIGKMFQHSLIYGYLLNNFEIHSLTFTVSYRNLLTFIGIRASLVRNRQDKNRYSMCVCVYKYIYKLLGMFDFQKCQNCKNYKIRQ